MTWRRIRRKLRRWCRRHPLLAIAAAAALALLVIHAAHSDAAGGPAVLAVAPGGSGPYTPASWAQAFIGALHDPQTACNVGAVTAWEAAEGGNWDNSAQYNPLDTTQPEPGAWSINSVGVKAYPTWSEGLQANLTAITNGLYGPVLSALGAGDDAQAVADAVAASPWGTEPFTASC